MHTLSGWDQAHRAVLHFDLDAFYAAVEVLLNPSLAGRPIVIGGDPQSRGVVSTASYEARGFGVRSAMPAALARRLCPQGVFLRPRHSVYREYSRQVFTIVARYSQRVQAVSIDEGFIELDPATAAAEARALKAEIRAQTGLTASLGLSTSRLVSKIASDHGKPDGFVVVEPGTEAAFLAPLPLRALWGVDPKTAERLASAGLHTVGDVAAASHESLALAVGGRLARGLAERARGIDESPVRPPSDPKSLSQEATFPRDESDSRALWQTLSGQCEGCAEDLARHGFVARTVTVKLRYADFRTITRSMTLPFPTDDAGEIRSAVAALMRAAWSEGRHPLRLVGVRVSGLSPRPSLRQLTLLL